MTGRRKLAIAVAAIAASHVLGGSAWGDPAPAPAPAPAPSLTGYIHLQSGSHISTDGGTKLDLPPGYFFDEPTFNKLDADVKQLQDDNTSKDAQIKVYRAQVEKWQPGWMTLAGAVVGGIVLGWYLHEKL